MKTYVVRHLKKIRRRKPPILKVMLHETTFNNNSQRNNIFQKRLTPFEPMVFVNVITKRVVEPCFRFMDKFKLHKIFLVRFLTLLRCKLLLKVVSCNITFTASEAFYRLFAYLNNDRIFNSSKYSIFHSAIFTASMTLRVSLLQV